MRPVTPPSTVQPVPIYSLPGRPIAIAAPDGPCLESDDPTYRQLIEKFYLHTGVLMVLNTSFNTLPGEPIVKRLGATPRCSPLPALLTTPSLPPTHATAVPSPCDAACSFLHVWGALDALFLENHVLARRPADLRSLLTATPVRAGPDVVRTTEVVGTGDDGPVTAATFVSLSDLYVAIKGNS